jgi:hypothetical protein
MMSLARETICDVQVTDGFGNRHVTITSSCDSYGMYRQCSVLLVNVQLSSLSASSLFERRTSRGKLRDI